MEQPQSVKAMMRSVLLRHATRARPALQRAAAPQRRGIKYSSEERGGIRPSSAGRTFYEKWLGDASMWPLLIMTGGASLALIWWMAHQGEKAKELQKAQPRALQLEHEKLYKEVQDRT